MAFLVADAVLSVAAALPRAPAAAVLGDVPALLRAGFRLVFPLHLWLSLYDGRFGGRFGWARASSWPLMLLAQAVAVVTEFMGAGRPPGAESEWAATAAAGLLVLDAGLLHAGTWRGRRLARAAALVAGAGAVAAGVAAVLLPGGVRPAPPDNGGFAIVPPWYLLPYFALVRTLPDKVAGVAVALGVLLLPMAWPWLRADRARSGRGRPAFTLLWAGTAVAWAGLGWAGTQPPYGAGIAVARAAAAWLFAFGAVAAWLGRRNAGPDGG